MRTCNTLTILLAIAMILSGSITAANAGDVSINEDFESPVGGALPSDWSLVTINNSPTPTYDGSVTGYDGDGLGGQITSNSWNNTHDRMPGAYIVNSTIDAFDAMQPITGSFDFRVDPLGSKPFYAAASFIMGDIKTDFTGTDAGQFVSAHLGINTFGPKCVLVDGSGATLETSINLGAATWYKVEFSWTPTTETTDEATGAFSYTVNSTGGSTVGTLTTTTEVTLDSSDVYFGFGGAQPSAYGPTGATFDNISITGHTPAPTTMLWQTDVIGNWTSENWTTDDGETYVVPVAGLGMFVNSGKVTVAAAPVETPLSLDVAMAGTVEVASAASLTVTEAVNVGDGGTLAMGGGSKILSSAAVPLDGDATITVAGTLAGASDDTSAFGDMGNDGGTVNLTLTGDSTYEVTCVGALDDDDNPIVVDTSIDVTGKLTMEAGATIDLNLGAGDITNGTVMLFRTYYDEFDIDGVVFDLDDPDNPSDLAAAGINLTSNGEALVGATLAWSEYIYDEPLDAEFIYLTLTGVTLINDTVLGDANGDKVVNETDLNFLLAQFGSAYDLSLTADFNDDGYVDLADFVILRAHWGDGAAAPDASVLPTATPEPATLIFLAAGLPALLKRRRRRS